MLNCLIYDKRPEVCRQFPSSEQEIKDFPKCGYYFKNGKRFGECNGCNQCCVYMHWTDDSTIESCTEKIEFEDGKVKTDVVCRFLG